MLNVRWISISALVISIDQITKFLAKTHLNPQQPLPIFPSFDLVLMYNTGAAFSLLHNAGGWQRYLFIAITGIVLIVLLNWLANLDKNQKLLSFGLALIIGGAIGNLIDRIVAGQVVDFISVYYLNWRWPAFNIADSAISLGVGLLFIDILFAASESN